MEVVLTNLTSSDESTRREALRALPALLFEGLTSPSLSTLVRLVNIAEKMHRLPTTKVLDAASNTLKLSGAKLDASSVLLLILDAAEMPCETRSNLETVALETFVHSLVCGDATGGKSCFWNVVHNGLRLPVSNRGVRKLATSLLVRGLDYVKRFEAERAVDVAIQAWDTFILFLDALEDFPPHLLDELWDAKASVFVSRPDKIVSNSVDPFITTCTSPVYVDNIPIPTFVAPMSFVWASVIFDRAYSHDNPSVRRSFLTKTFTHAVLCAGDARGPATTAAITAIPGGPIPSSSESQDSISAGYVPLGNYTSSSLPEEYEEKAGSNFGLVLGSFVPGGETRKAAAASADAAAAAAAASAVSSISESRPISIGLSFPTWFVASPCGSHLLTHLNESSLFTGALETTGRGLHDFILSYGAVLFEQRSSNNKEEFSAWVRALVEGLYACMICKGAVKWVLRSLAAISLHIHHRQVKCNNSMIPTIALPRPLNESSLSSLRMIYSGISLINTRTFTRNVALTVINVISTLCDPSLIPIPDLAMTLSMLPASIVLIKRESRQIIEQWLASSNVLTGQSDDDENLGPLLLRLRTAIDAYLSGKLPQVMIENLKVASTPPLLLSAAGLARIATLALDYNGNKKDTVAKKSAMSLFNSLTSALSSLQSRSYLDPKLRSRAILLTEALVFAAFAKGGRGDAHLSFSISGGALPTAPSEIQVPLFAEWSAASRFAVAAYSKIYMRAPLQDSWENPAAPFEDESDFENSIEISHFSSHTNMSTYVLSLSVVAEEFSATLESVIAEGLSLSTVSPTARAIWCPRHGILDKGKESAGRKFDNVAPYPPPPLPFYTALCILRDLSRIQGEGTHLYKTSSERLVNMAIRVLHTISTSTDSLSSASTAIRFVNITNALHTLASLYSSISGDSVSISDVIKSCLSVISSKPRGSTEPALPVHLGNSPSMLDVTNLLNENQQWRSFSNEFSNTTCPLCCPTFDTDKRVLGDEDSRNSSSEKAVSWMSLRSSLETSRWLSIASCLSALLSARPSLSHTSYSTSPQGKQSLLACLPLDLAEDLAVATMDALSICSDGSSGVAALYVSGLVLRALPLEGEDSSHVVMANNIFNKSSKGDNVLTGSSVRFEDFLDALERIMITPKTSRRLAEAYASCVASPELFMRTSLHISISGAGYGPLLRHLLAIVELFSTESANHHLLQCLTSKLCNVWASLFQVSEETHSLEATTTCRKVLLANVPLMTRLLLHREFLSIHEDPALCDATARSQLREWIRYHRGDVEAAEFDKSTTVARSLRPHGSAGALVRIQMLCWLERMLTVKGAINRQTMLLVVKDLTLLLLTLNMTPELMVESIPGSTMHSTKLRAWQALSLIAREWGRFGIEGDDSNSKYCKISDVFLIDADDEMTLRRIARAEALLPSSPAAASVICTRFLALAAPPIPQNATKLKAKKGKSQVAAISGDDGGIFTKSRDVNTLMTFEDIADLALAFQIVVFKHQLSLTQQPSTRQYLEACSAAVARRFPTTSFKAVLLSLLSAGYAKTQLAFSLMLVCADLASSLALRASSLETLPASTKSMLASLSYQIIVATFPWTSSPMGLVRVVAISSLVRTVTILFPDSRDKSNRKPSLLPPPPGLDEWVRPLIRLSMNSPDLKDMIQRQEKHFARLHPENALSIESLLTSPSTEHGELISADAYSYFKATFQRITVELHERDPANIVDEDFLDARADAAMKAGLIPQCSQIDQRYCLGFGDSTFHGPFGSDSNEVQQSIHSPEEAMNLQRKINSQMALSASAKEKTSHSALSASTSEDSVRPHAATLALREKHHPLLTFAAEPSLNAGSDSVRGDAIPDGRRYQPAIVLASLVTKVPNLGGLARTCEVLGLQSLVVHDIRIRSDQEFKSISVSAADWLPLHGCRAEHMLSYIRARRKQGYTIVGLEQAARSVRLGSAACILPDQCVFVLGAEKEGIPVALLQELDIVVEIPQLGMTRSMNVHVSASLLLWEYTRQRMNRAGFE